MILNQAEYEHARAESKAQTGRLKIYGAKLRREWYTDDEVRRVMKPLISFHLGRREEIEAFEQAQIE